MPLSSRLQRWLAIAALAIGVSACTTAALVKVAYDHGDWAVRLMAHEYLDLHGDQSDTFKSEVQKFHAWHRRNELPHYASLSAAFAERIQRGLAADDVKWAAERVRVRYRTLADRAVVDTTPLLATLGASNIEALERKFAESNTKFEKEFMQGPPEKRERARVKAIRKRIEDFTGTLRPEQEALVVAYVRESPQYSSERFAERLARQQQLVRMLREHRRDPDLTERLRGYFVRYDRDRGPQYEKMSAAWEERLTRLVLDLDRTLTPEQRASTVRRFTQLSRDFGTLAGVPAPAPGDARRAGLN
jgi:hypothetical protein